MVGATVAITIAASTGFFVIRDHPRQAPPVTAAVPPHETPQPAPPPVGTVELGAPRIEMVKLHVGGTPNAEVLLDDVPIGQVPLDIELPRAAHRSLVVRRAGYAPLAKLVPGDTDVSVTMTLHDRVKRPAPSAARRGSAGGPTNVPVVLKNPFARSPGR
jgi:hypothetical protein